MKHFIAPALTLLFFLSACAPDGGEMAMTDAEPTVHFMTLDPGHFHAGLVHKYEYEQVDSVVHIYAPGGQELESHLALIERFNTREDDPTSWSPVVYTGEDYLERLLEEKPGNVMVVAGNNGRKIDYIRSAVEEGINVLADKPMIIHPDDFPVLLNVMASADEQGLLVYDIMTERHEVTSVLQRALSQNADVFGELRPGSPEEPAISKESVHYFYKVVAGEPLVRPAWFYDVTQQGEAIADVSTHLVDLILWQLFPEEPIDYEDETDGVEVVTARRWMTDLTTEQFERSTHLDTYPSYLAPYLDDDSILHVAANGEFVFRVRGVHGKVSVRWGFENPEGGDTHYSILRGTGANLVIRQDAPQNYRATLYVEPAAGRDPQEFESALNAALEELAGTYPGLSTVSTDLGWEVRIPEQFREGHEEHFTRVTELFLDYLDAGVLPEWERQNIETKYYVTTRAYAQSR